MRIKIKQIAALALVFALVASAAGPASAALTYDNETVDSTSKSDLVGDETVTDLDNGTIYKTIQVTSGNATSSSLSSPEEAFTLELQVNDSDSDEDGRVFYTNTSTAKVIDATNGTYAFNISHAEMFDELERDVDENVTVDVVATFNESEDDEESATIQIHAQNDDDRAVEVISDDDFDDEDGVEEVNESRTLRDDLEYMALDTDTSITENTTVSFVLANDTAEQKYVDAYDAGDFDSGDYIYSMTGTVENTPVMVFDEKKGDEIDAGYFGGGFDDTEDTYAVYLNDGGDYGDSAQIDFVPGDDHEDKSSLEIESNGNLKLGFYDTWRNFGLDAARTAGFGVVP